MAGNRIRLKNNQISSLHGLQQFKALALDLSNNQISSLEGAAGLQVGFKSAASAFRSRYKVLAFPHKSGHGYQRVLYEESDIAGLNLSANKIVALDGMEDWEVILAPSGSVPMYNNPQLAGNVAIPREGNLGVAAIGDVKCTIAQYHSS